MENSKSNLGVPIAIVIAGLLVAGAIYLGQNKSPAPVADNTNPPANTYQLDKMTAVSQSEHLRGNPEAKIVLVDYSDLECPFCKMFHWSMQEIMKKYSDQIAWVYRHYPLDCNGGTTPGCRALHPKARKEAEASECVAELGGNDKFWQYIDKIFEVTPSNDGLDLAELPKIAKEIGIDETAFNACLASGRSAARVQADSDNGDKIGIDGTPFVVLLAPNDIRISALRGALPENADALTKEIMSALNAEQQKSYQKLLEEQN